MSLASVSYRQVEAIVQTWTKKYQYHISLIQTKPSEVKFMVEFSLPQPQKPVPVATIRVYFTCTNYDNLKVTFRFQKDSLIHSPNKTIRQQQIEKWIDDSLSKKLLVRETVFYLGTAYEKTRVKDVRQDNILRQVIKPVQTQYVFIHPDLLSDQRRFIQIMDKPHVNVQAVERQLKQYFQQIDKQNIGVITQAEFIKLIKNVGIKLNPLEQKELIKRVDPQETGMVQYLIYKNVISEFVEGLEAKGQAQARLKINEEQEIFGSILMLIDDEAQDIADIIIQKFKAQDENETGKTDISQIKTVLDQINKEFKQNQKPEPLSVIELSEVSKSLTDQYGYKEIPYNKIHKAIIDYKIKELSAGRINSRMNNLEVHLKQIFEPYDIKKQGKIKLEHFQQALTKSEKIHLLKSQIYLLKSLVSVDVRGQMNYAQNSKFLGEFIKKLYLNSSKKKEQ